jgi:hypothetical protein
VQICYDGNLFAWNCKKEKSLKVFKKIEKFFLGV